jgi:hypothetical protein
MVERIIKQVKLGRFYTTDTQDPEVENAYRKALRIIRSVNGTEYQRSRLGKRGGWRVVKIVTGKWIHLLAESYYNDSDGPPPEDLR